jgi:hypothetical protein
MDVYLLQHLHVLNEDDEDVKTCGIFASREEAEAAVATLSMVEGFRGRSRIIDPLEDDDREGFYIDRHVVGQVLWSGGFITVPSQ